MIGSYIADRHSRSRFASAKIPGMSKPASEIRGEYWDCGTREQPRPHVIWICPACGRQSETDIEPDDRPPMLLECEFFKCDSRFHAVTWDYPLSAP